MPSRMRFSGLAAVAAVCVFATVAHADPKGDIATKAKSAMDSYDMMDYEAARKTLTQAVALAKKSKLDKDPLIAKVYLDLGIVAFAVPDPDAAKLAFLSAVQIDPKIQIDAAYRSAEMAKLLEEARTEAGGGPGPGEPMNPPGVDCSSVKGLQHNLVDTSKANSPANIEAMIGTDLSPAKISLMYRPEHATDWVEVKMSRQGCKLTGAIPASGTHGSVVHYYVAAYDAENKVIAEKGSSGSPNIIELTAGGTVAGDTENPMGGGGGNGSGGSVGAKVERPGKPGKVYIAAAGGTGFGYVTGQTEGGNVVKNCCIGTSLVVLDPEIGYMVSPQLSIGVAGRIGLPVDATAPGHATGAVAGLARLRYALSPTGDGVRLMAQAGVGVLRNTIKLDDGMTGMDVDIVAQGPLLVGGGLGFKKHLSSKVAFVVDFSVLAGIAISSSFGDAPNLNSGVTGDLTLGLALGL